MSDIHSNHTALKACFAEIGKQAVDAVIYLGDYFTDCPYPEKTLSFIREKSQLYPTYIIRGNREDYLLEYRKYHSKDWTYGTATGSLLYTYDNLTPEDLNFLESLPPVQSIRCENIDILLCHGSPIQSRESLFPDTKEAQDHLMKLSSDLLLCGHTHRQYDYTYNGKKIINPGSVGIQVGGQAEAQFVVLQIVDDRVSTRFFSVPYDIESAVREFEESYLLQKGGIWSRAVIKALRTGIDYPEKCFSLAAKLAGNRPKIDEEYWIQAAKELKL